jgi:6-phosphogluconate dehydrogenase (decarboxylating)
MELAMAGSNRMGVNTATRLMRGNHRMVAFDLNEEALQRAEARGAEGVRNINEYATEKAFSFSGSPLLDPAPAVPNISIESSF